MSRDALVVGINTYEFERLKDLTTPSEDAEAIAQLLTDYSDFKVRRLPAVEKEGAGVRVGKKTKVGLNKLEDALVQLFKPEGNNIPDTALLYFSGHGLRKNKGIQEGFLATSDANPDLGLYGLPLQWLRRLLQESPIRQQIIILDCCYSGELLNFAEADPGDRGKGKDRCFIAASREFETADTAVDCTYSAFTKALLQALDPRRYPGQWIANYSLVDFLDRNFKEVPQSFLFANSGGAINLTRTSETSRGESAKTVVTSICPYKGLEYFDCNEEDAKFFYGRTALTDRLLEKVRVGNFLAVLGASGSGKSSVVRAGLLYQLKQGRRLSGSEEWQIRIFRPGEHPLQSLAFAFVGTGLSDIDRATQLAKAEKLIGKGTEGLRQLVTAADTKRLVLVADQFEEVFTLCKNPAERQKFFECLLGAFEQTGDKLCLVLTMRADFFGKCAEQDYAGLASKIQEHLVTVTPMQREELEQAITEPAKQVGLKLEPELVSQMIADVEGSPGSLPLLQYTLTELCKQRTENRLMLSTYTRLGGVKGTLQKRASEVYESLSAKEKLAAKLIFLELTQLGEGTEDTRRRVLQQDLVTSQYPEAMIEEVVQKLADARLIVTQEESFPNPKFDSPLSPPKKGGVENPKSVVVDVAHEALIYHWLELRKWIEENRDLLRQKRKIEAAAEDWRSQGKVKDYLLQGKSLTDAIGFQKQQTGKLALSKLAEEFIQKSIRQRRNNRLKLIAFAFIIPLGLAVYLGVVGKTQMLIGQLWQTVNAAQGQQYSPGRNQALVELVKLGVSLERIDLSGANLWGANLSGANLWGANLSGANLSGANLSGANLSGANLWGANFWGANLSSADLSGADLSSANLSDANLWGADLSGAKLSGADLSGANLWGAYFWGAKISGAKLWGANLSGANLSDANLRGANLSGADLSGTDLSRANLSGANLSGANLSDAKINEDTQLDPKWRLVWDIVNRKTEGRDLSNADLNNANLSGAYLKRARLVKTQLRNTVLSGANLVDANLIGADLLGANLSGADLSGAEVKNARFGYNSGISEAMKRDLIGRGAIFEDSPGDRSSVLTPV